MIELFYNITQNILRDFFCFQYGNETTPWRHIYHDTEIPRPKTTRHRDSKIRETKTPRHWETETIKPRHRDSKAFFQRTKSYDIGIPRLKSHDIEIPGPRNDDLELLWNSDPYAPWYSSRGAYLPRLFRTRRAPLSKFPSLRKQQCSIRYQAFFKRSLLHSLPGFF